jgi:uncharacterized protein with PIN domain
MEGEVEISEKKEVVVIVKKKVPETVVCDKCGFSYKKNNKWRHMGTKKHNESININKLKNYLNGIAEKL